MNQIKLSETAIYTILATISVSIFVIASFYTAFNLPLYIFSIGIASIFIFKKPEVGLYTNIILTIVFGYSYTLVPLTGNETIYKIYPIDILVIITILSFLLYKLQNPKIKIKVDKLGIYILIFSLFSLFSMIYGIYRGGNAALAFSTFKNYAIYSIFFFIIINVIRDKDKLKQLIKVFLYSGIVLLLFTILGYSSGRGLWIEATPLSTEGTRLLAPNHAFYLCVAFLLAMSLLAYRQKVYGKLTILIILAQLMGIIGSLTRHLWISLFVASIIIFTMLRKKYKNNLLKIIAIQFLFIIVIIIIYALFSFILTEEIKIFGLEYIESAITRFESLFTYSTSEDLSIYFRFFAWEKAFSLLLENMIFGIGFGQHFTFDFFGYPTIVEARELHNNFIGMILQMGILGFLSFIALNIVFIRKIYVLYKKNSKKLTPYLLGALGCYLLFIISANFGTYFDVNVLVTFFWSTMAIVVVIENILKKEIKEIKEIK